MNKASDSFLARDASTTSAGGEESGSCSGSSGEPEYKLVPMTKPAFCRTLSQEQLSQKIYDLQRTTPTTASGTTAGHQDKNKLGFSSSGVPGAALVVKMRTERFLVQSFDMIMSAMTLLAVSSYFMFLADFVTELLAVALPPESLPSRSTVIMCLGCVALPAATIDKLTELKFLSSFSLGSMLFLIAVVFVEASLGPACGEGASATLVLPSSSDHATSAATTGSPLQLLEVDSIVPVSPLEETQGSGLLQGALEGSGFGENIVIMKTENTRSTTTTLSFWPPVSHLSEPKIDPGGPPRSTLLTTSMPGQLWPLTVAAGTNAYSVVFFSNVNQMCSVAVAADVLKSGVSSSRLRYLTLTAAGTVAALYFAVAFAVYSKNGAQTDPNFLANYAVHDPAIILSRLLLTGVLFLSVTVDLFTARQAVGRILGAWLGLDSLDERRRMHLRHDCVLGHQRRDCDKRNQFFIRFVRSHGGAWLNGVRLSGSLIAAATRRSRSASTPHCSSLAQHFFRICASANFIGRYPNRYIDTDTPMIARSMVVSC
ncbi:unnamed protein product [Amoebophrya sp. A25]|nr:unnamed protein product [Amoebophrya sp. A25]|eukprot:GSA25T00018947001.1